MNVNWMYGETDCFHFPKSQPGLLSSPADKHTLIAAEESKKELNNPLKANQSLLAESVDTRITGKCFLVGSTGARGVPQGAQTGRSPFHQLMECLGVVAVSRRISKISFSCTSEGPWEVGANSLQQQGGRIRGIAMATQQSQPQRLSGISAICANWITSPKG